MSRTKRTRDEIGDEIMEYLKAHGSSRIEANRFIENHAAPHTWQKIEDDKLRELIEEMHGANW